MKCDATLTITISDVLLECDPATMGKVDIEDALSDALRKVLGSRLKLLDIKGGRSGEDGWIDHIDIESIDDWVAA